MAQQRQILDAYLRLSRVGGAQRRFVHQRGNQEEIEPVSVTHS